MIDIVREDCVPLVDAPKLLPPGRCGKRVHISTIYRWTRRGVRGIRLKVIRIGGVSYTSIQALREFVEACTTTGATSKVSTPHWRKQQVEEAEQALDELGM